MEVKVKLVPSGIDEDGEEQHLELDAAIIETLRPLLKEAVVKKVNDVSKTVIQKIALEHVAKLSTEAFAEVFQETDLWGKPKGEAKSLAEIVSGKVKSYLDEKVDERGNAHYTASMTRCQWMVLSAIRGAIKGELDARLTTLRTEFAEHLAKKIAKVKLT